MAKKSTRLALATTAGLISAIGLASPALAHDTRYDGPYACGITEVQSCGYGQVRDSHQIVDACDTREDGRGYFVEYTLQNGTKGSVNDGNGAASGCGIKRVGTTANPVYSYRVCSNQGGGSLNVCSGIKIA
ncbi:hypothetical protein [Actinoplanes derwentensis]|uniref:Secreted protein n=1 Tax=Actinoplanes derwentensis TaxID=113562 RepID=A0A1H1Q6K9_9ACTN|nr:hypothetical protein [Actinoplanes derwentensis]GID82219.1 hypothetical protein Ade03nite_11430 [Actinoplanes derwentensis]SDS19148.1 hypothetical protein SAMN04489716_0222 [Actinoplanes derwentensis]